MKKLPLLFFFIHGFIGTSQTVLVSQPNIAMEYQIPKSWKVQEFFKTSWDEPGGSSVCPCAGTINILKIPAGGDEFEYIHMVAYPSDKKGQNVEKRRGAWQYRFVPVENADTINYANFIWLRYTSKFVVHGGENRFKDCVVWKLESHKGKTYYTLYFWARPTVFKEHQPEIEKIIASFKGI
ncbi:MAG: hypothetical protein ACJ76F_07045 [Bacteroidia bacterium]